MRNYPRVYTSFMPNAPVCSGVPGAWLNILKKCLIEGFPPFTISSIQVVSGVGTINFNVTDCSLPDFCILLISGCDEPLLNGEITITKGAQTTGKFVTAVADGTYTGASLQAVIAPAGWELMFTGTNQAVIRSGNPDSSRTVVKIVDTNSTTCSFDFALDARSISVLVDNATTILAQNKCQLKALDAVAGNKRNWYIVCDNTTVYMAMDTNAYSYFGREYLTGGRISYFGDYIAANPLDANPFGYYFQPIDNGAFANDVSYLYSSPQASCFWENDPFYVRAGIRSDYLVNAQWTLASFSSSLSVAQGYTYRNSGSTSKYNIFNLANINKTHKEIPVQARLSAATSLFTILGSMPGIRFSEFNIKYLFQPFTTSSDDDVDIFLNIPCNTTNKTSNEAGLDQGMMPFLINKKWGD